MEIEDYNLSGTVTGFNSRRSELKDVYSRFEESLQTLRRHRFFKDSFELVRFLRSLSPQQYQDLFSGIDALPSLRGQDYADFVDGLVAAACTGKHSFCRHSGSKRAF